MDLRELVIGTKDVNREETLRALTDGIKKHLWTAMPVIVEKDSDGHKATLKVAIKARQIDQYGKLKHVDFPLLDDVPIHFPQGGGVVHTFPIKKGDEGIVVFASRALDAWRQSGGVQQAIDTRMHALSDAMFIPGHRSDPRKIRNNSTESAQVRSDDGKHTIDHHPDNGTTIKSVDKSDGAKNPFKDATRYFASIFKAAEGIIHKAVDGDTTHKVSVDHDNGPVMSANNDAHTVQAHPTNGISITSAAKVALTAPSHIIDAITQITKALSAQSMSAPSASFGAMSAGSMSAGSMSAGGNSVTGVLAGDVTGPEATTQVVKITKFTNFAALPNCANDAAAATAGVAVDGPYRNGSALCFRVS